MDPTQAESWKVSLPCNRPEAELIAESLDLLADLPVPPVLLTREPDPDKPDQWMLDAYLDARPDAAMLARLKALVPSSGKVKPVVEKIDAQDWVTLSQAGIEPVNAGRFHVCTPTHAGAMPSDKIGFVIDAGRAFGTGQHETTTGCLLTIDALKRQGARFINIVDVGTGTGILAFAARKVWPLAQVIASDIDPVSIEVTAENGVVNDIRTGRGRGAIELVVAPGLAHPRLRRRAPYDLIVANILAGPLIDLAPSLSSALEAGGTLVLAGLLDTQADDVIAAYRRRGLRLAGRIQIGDWPTLRLVKRRA